MYLKKLIFNKMDKKAGDRIIDIKIKEDIKPDVIEKVELKVDDNVPQGYNLNEFDIMNLRDQAIVWGFSDELIDVHSSVDLKDFEKFDISDIDLYAEAMNYWDVINTKTYVMKLQLLLLKKQRFIELMKRHEHIELILFRMYRSMDRLNNDVKELDLIYYEVPDEDEVMNNGMDFYYLRIGSLTVQNLLARYTREELMMFLVPIILLNRKPYAFDVLRTNDQLAAEIVSLTKDLKRDVRNILGPNMIWKVHNLEPKEQDLLISDFWHYDVDNLYDAFYWQGLTGDQYNADQVYAEYCLNVLTKPNFCTSIMQSKVRIDEDDTKYYVNNVVYGDDALFYGIRIGGQKYNMYSQKELAKSFDENKAFIDPLTGKEFPYYAIRRLRMICNDTLREVIDKYIDGYRLVLTDTTKFSKSNYYDAMSKLLTMSSEFLTWETLTARFNIDSIIKSHVTNLVTLRDHGEIAIKVFRYLMITMNAVNDCEGMPHLNIIKIIGDHVYVSEDTIIGYLNAFVKLKDLGAYRIISLLSQYLLHSFIYYQNIVLPDNSMEKFFNIEI